MKSARLNNALPARTWVPPDVLIDLSPTAILPTVDEFPTLGWKSHTSIDLEDQQNPCNGGFMPASKKIQEVLDQISKQRQGLLDASSGLSEAQLDYKPAEDQWSISDILHHMALTDESSAKLAANMLMQAETQKLPADPSPEASVLGSLDEFMPKITGSKVQAPDRVAPRSHLPAAESIARLMASREKVVATWEHLGEYDLISLTYPHPLLGDLNAYQWLIIAGRHESRHTAQIGRVKADPGFPA